MKTTKRRFEQFLFYDYTGIERHLERMAAKGWQLHKITRLYWEYRRAEPQKRTYTVTYFSEASEFNPYPTENQQTFYEYCNDAGWNLVAEWAQMQVFCSERENPTSIETDESVKLKAIHRAMKKNFLPSSVVLLLLSVFLVYLQLDMIASNPVEQLSLGLSPFVAAIWSVLFIQTFFSLTGYASWYRQSQKDVRMGGTCAESGGGYKKLFYVLTGVIAVLFALAVPAFTAASTRGYIASGIIGALNVTVIIVLVLTIKNALKRAEASRKVNLSVTVVSCVVLSIVLTGVTTWFIIRNASAGWSGHQPAATYTTIQPNGATHTWDIYHDPLPLQVEDLQDVAYSHYSYKWTARESFFLAHYVARQDSFPDGQFAPELSYAIADVKLSALFDLCLTYYLNLYHDEQNLPEEDRRFFRLTDDPAWQADAAYQLYRHDESSGEYVLCWGSRIVHIRFDEIPTPQQIAIAVEKLSPSNLTFKNTVTSTRSIL